MQCVIGGVLVVNPEPWEPGVHPVQVTRFRLGFAFLTGGSRIFLEKKILETVMVRQSSVNFFELE